MLFSESVPDEACVSSLRVCIELIADFVNGRHYATVLRPSVVCLPAVCNVYIVAIVLPKKMSKETNRKWPMGNGMVTDT